MVPNTSTEFAGVVVVGLRSVETQAMIMKADLADAEGAADVAEVVVDLNKLVIRAGALVAGGEDLEGPATMEGTVADTVVARLRPRREGLHPAPRRGEAIEAEAVALHLDPPSEHPLGLRMVALGLSRELHQPVGPAHHHALRHVHHPQGSVIAFLKADPVQLQIRHLVPRQESVSVPRRTLVLRHPRHVADALAPPVAPLHPHDEGHVGCVLPDRAPAHHRAPGDVIAS